MDVTVHRYSNSWHPKWEAFVEENPDATLAHAARWLRVFSEALGHEDRSLIAERDGEVCGVLPMMVLKHWFFGTFHVSLPWLDYGGIIADGSDTCRHLFQAAIAQAKADGASFVEFRSVEKTKSDLPSRDDKLTFLLELSTTEEVWKRLDSKVRNQVRKAKRSGLRCQFGREELLPIFYRVFAQNMRDLGTPVWSIDLFRTILATFPKESEIAVVWHGQQAISVGLTVAFADKLAMPSASTLRKFRPLCSNNLLYWEVIKRASEAGYRIFDFGRSTVGSGTYHFKKQWGPKVIPLHWHYVLINGESIPRLNPSNPKFKPIIEVWKRLPLRFATWLGPRIVHHIP